MHFESKMLNKHVDTYFIHSEISRLFSLPCSRYVSTVLEVYFDRARGILRPCSRFTSTLNKNHKKRHISKTTRI